MKVLITNITLGGRTGTEIVVRDLALGLKRRGRQPVVYSPRLGDLADEIAGAGVQVTDDIEAVGAAPDVIHGHHVIQTGIACARYPTTPALFVRHDALAWHDAAPRLPNVVAHAVVNEAFRAELAEDAGVAPETIALVPNAVDLDRFRPGPDLPPRPRRALAFAKNQGHLEAIREACAARNIALDVVGAMAGRVATRPEALMPGYDLIFASALTAIEAMATGRAVVAMDGRGLAGMVTPDRYPSWRPFNFALGTFDQPLSAPAVGAEIDRYDPAGAVAVSARVRAEAGLEAWVDRWLALYEDVAATKVPPPSPQAMAGHLQTWDPSRAPSPWLAERAALTAQIESLQTGLGPLPLNQPVAPADGATLGLSGFHPPEDFGAWSARSHTAIRLKLAPGPAPTRLRLCLAAFAPAQRPQLNLTLLANGQPIGAARLEGAEARWLEFPLDLAKGDADLWIAIRSDDVLSPSRTGVSADLRELGFALLGLELG